MRCVVLAIGSALLLGGCSKPGAATTPVTTSPAADATPDPSPATPPPPYTPPANPMPTVAVSPDGGADLRQLNHIYIGWIVQNRRRPHDFNDFISSSGIQIPPAPEGKKYVFDKNGFIALANQ